MPEQAPNHKAEGQQRRPAGQVHFGQFSLWIAKTGGVLLVLFAIIMLVLRDRNILQVEDIPAVSVFALILFGLVEAFSLVCGFVARHTQAGKSGMWLSGGLLLILIAQFFFSSHEARLACVILGLPLILLATRRKKSM
jgi:hypothetical protein